MIDKRYTAIEDLKNNHEVKSFVAGLTALLMNDTITRDQAHYAIKGELLRMAHESLKEMKKKKKKLN